MRFFILFISIFVSFQILIGQTISSISAANAAQFIVGNGITISNAQFTGDPSQLSKIENGPSPLGINNGIVLTTNKRSYLQSGNTSETAGAYQVSSQAIDSDLSQLSGNSNMHARAYLEFDFIPNGSEISFEFVFSSNEYPGYNCCIYNDVFGFFLSGPGISNQNIAVVPSTNIPFSINTVNNGVPGSACLNPIYCNTVYTNYYNNSAWFYGGSTKVIATTKELQCQQTYHLKIAICNIGDNWFNSAIFIKGQSLKSDFNLGPILSNVQPICEGQDLTLTTTGSDGYTYSWSNETGPIQSNIDLKQITIPASTVNSQYSVSITNPEGCTLTQNVNVVVHSLANNPPHINGMNNMGEYTAYVNAGQQICFDIPSFDDNPEMVSMNWNNGIPDAIFTANGSPFEEGHFCWTPTQDQVGWHSFIITVTDNNVCNVKFATYTFRIKVICSWELLCIDYENYNPISNPLPFYTSTGKCINAGLTEPTLVGSSNVTFEAPEINLGAFFDGNPPFFDAIINANTAIIGCESCCDDFNGFTVDTPLPNVFTPNGDDINDIWFASDLDNPKCAFNAKGFEFYVVDRWGILVYSQVDNEDLRDDHCCPYRSPDAPNSTDHSSIYWDGIANHDVIHTWWQIFFEGADNFYNGDLVNPDYYFYKLTLFGCEHEEVYQGFIYVNSSSGLVQNDNPPQILNSEFKDFQVSNEVEMLGINQTQSFDNEWQITVYPNPTVDEFVINSSIENCRLTIYNAEGKKMFSKSRIKKNELFNISNFSSGNYKVLINSPAGMSREIIIIKN